MTKEDILDRIQKHYASSEDVLLLSDLGASLGLAGLWPIEGEDRPLSEVVQGLTPDVSLVRDPKSKAYVVIVPKGKEDLALRAIDRRHKIHFLRQLPRAVLLAFCVEAPAGSHVYLRLQPPYRYLIAAQPLGEGYMAVEDQFRTPGLFIDDPRSIAADDAERLSSKIQEWASTHSISFEEIKAIDRAERHETSDERPKTPSGVNALERLYSAQAAGVAEKMVVPADIAVTLSRMP